jgi:hypothetical protein
MKRTVVAIGAAIVVGGLGSVATIIVIVEHSHGTAASAGVPDRSAATTNPPPTVSEHVLGASGSPSASVSVTTPGVASVTPSPATSRAAASPTPTSAGGSPANSSPGGNPLLDEVWGDDAVPFRPPTSTDYLNTPLGQQSFGGHAASLVPAGWKFADETIPSDHNDLLWYDPANPAARIEFSGTGCVVCVEENIYATNPVRDAARGLPADTTSYYVYNHGLDAGFRETDASGYAVNGVVALTGSNADPSGYVLYRIVLPVKDKPLATRILNSFTGFG